jgi:hypothetical protein
MRMAFGLVSLLVGVGLMFLFFYQIEVPQIEVGHDAQQQVQQLAGRDENGVPVEQTYTLQAETRPDGKLKDLLVTHLNLGTPMESYFGLKEKDQIVSAIGQGGFQTDFGGSDDEEGAKLAVRDAYALKGKIIVLRGGERLTLPQPGQAAISAAQQAAAANAPAPANSPGAANTPATPGNSTPAAGGNATPDTMQQIQDQLKGMH